MTLDAMRERADLRAAFGQRPGIAGGAPRATLRRGSGATRRPRRLAPELDGLRRAHEQSVAELGRGHGPRSASQLSFHANAIALVVAGIAADAEVAARKARLPEWLKGARRRWYEASGTAAASAQRVRSVAAEARRHATVRCGVDCEQYPRCDLRSRRPWRRLT